MKIKGNDVVGLDVISLDNGEKHGKVKQLVYDQQGHEIKALLIEGGGMFSDDKVLLIQDIRAIGKDAVTIGSQDALMEQKSVDESISTASKNDHYLTRTKIITENGSDLGQVTDIFFDTSTGKVTELEVSQGMFKNVKSGIKRVRVADITTIGRDATVVKAYTEQEIERQAQEGGVQGKIKSAREGIPGVLDEAKAKTREAVEDIKQKAQEVGEDPRTQRTLNKAKDKVMEVRDRVRDTGTKAREDLERTDKMQVSRDAGERIGKAAGNISRSAQEFAREVQRSMSQGYQSAKGGSASSEDHDKVETEQKQEHPSFEDEQVTQKKTVHTKIEEKVT